jgi:hypothetical protein
MVISEQEGFIKGFVCENGRLDLIAEFRPHTETRFFFNMNRPARRVKLDSFYGKKVKITVELL